MAHTSTGFATSGTSAYATGHGKTWQLAARAVAWVGEQRRINRTTAALSDLSDATLRDIGIERGNIKEVARYGKDAFKFRA